MSLEGVGGCCCAGGVVAILLFFADGMNSLKASSLPCPPFTASPSSASWLSVFATFPGVFWEISLSFPFAFPFDFALDFPLDFALDSDDWSLK